MCLKIKKSEFLEKFGAKADYRVKKIKKSEFLEKFGAKADYRVKKITLSKADKMFSDLDKEFVLALPASMAMTSERVHIISNCVPYTIDQDDGFIDMPQNFNVTQVTISPFYDQPVYLGMDEGLYILQNEDIKAIIDGIAQN